MGIKIMLASALMIAGLAAGAYLTFWTDKASAQTGGLDCADHARRAIQASQPGGDS